MSLIVSKIAELPGFEIIGIQFGRDVEFALKTALSGGVIFNNAGKPLSIFREAIAASTRDIEYHPKGILFQEFLSKGPYEDQGEIPTELVSSRLSDTDTASVITFIYSFMVNSFKHSISEMLAASACLRFVKGLQKVGELDENAQIYVGEAVNTLKVGRGLSRGADLYILIKDLKIPGPQSITLAGVVEVAAYSRPLCRLRKQFSGDILKATRGLRICGYEYSAEQVNVGYGRKHRVLRIAIQPGNSKLTRRFCPKTSPSDTTLHVHSDKSSFNNDIIERIGDDEWIIRLKWSKENLAAAAFEMSFWYMEKVGEVVFSRGMPKEWSDMTPAQAGRNATKMMLYHAILRCHTRREEQRAIALYNHYSFGFELGKKPLGSSLNNEL